MTLKLLLAGLAALALAPAAVGAAPKSDSTAAPPRRDKESLAVLERACSASGGWDTYQKLRDVRFDLTETDFKEGRPIHGTSSTVLYRLHGPLKYRQVSEDSVVTATDGRIGWKISKGQLSTAREDSAGALLGARLYSFWCDTPFSLMNKDIKLKSLGPFTLHTKPFDLVMAVIFDSTVQYNDTYFLYFEHETGRLRGFTFTVAAMGKLIPDLAAWFDEYTRVGPLTVPLIQRFYGVTKDNYPDLTVPYHEYRRSKIQFDSGLDESLFQLPKH